jgi:FtsH-binding integral membrane protein
MQEWALMSGLTWRNPYSRADGIIIAPLTLVFVLVALVSTLENALGVSVSLSVLGIVVQTKWNSRSDPRMWALIGIVGAIQISAIFLIHIPRLSVGLICLPFCAGRGLCALRGVEMDGATLPAGLT